MSDVEIVRRYVAGVPVKNIGAPWSSVHAALRRRKVPLRRPRIIGTEREQAIIEGYLAGMLITDLPASDATVDRVLQRHGVPRNRTAGRKKREIRA